jgi:hypothetical protein
MSYEISWEAPHGFYAHFTGWVTPGSAARLARELTSDPRYDNLRYAIVDLTDALGHTFRRNDSAIGDAMVELIGAGFSNQRVHEIAIAHEPRMLNFLATYAKYTPRPFRIFGRLDDARRWLAEDALLLSNPAAK